MAKKKLDKDYFYGPITVADVETAAIERNLKVFIAMYEEPFLELLLGKPLYDAYVAGMAPGSPDTKWTALDNELYQVSGTAPDQVKLSPAAHYVYFHYIRDQVTQTTKQGEVINLSDNAKAVGSAPKAKVNWNAMVTRNRNIITWIKARPSDYPEYLEPVLDTSTHEALQLYKDRTDLVRTSILHF